MKIALLAFQFPPYPDVGAQRWKGLSRELARRGHEVHVYTVDWGAQADYYSSEFPGMHVHVTESGLPHLQEVLTRQNIWRRVFKRIRRTLFKSSANYFHDYSEKW